MSTAKNKSEPSTQRAQAAVTPNTRSGSQTTISGSKIIIKALLDRVSHEITDVAPDTVIEPHGKTQKPTEITDDLWYQERDDDLLRLRSAGL